MTEPAKIHRLNDDSLLRRRCRELELHKQGLNYAEIGERVGISRFTVCNDINILKCGNRKGKKGYKNGQ